MSIKLGSTHPMYNAFSEILGTLPIKEGMSVPTARISKKMKNGLVKYIKKTNTMTVHPDIFNADCDLSVLTTAYENAFISHRKGRLKGSKNKVQRVKVPKVRTGKKGRVASTESNLFKLITTRATRQFARILTTQCGDVKIVGDNFVAGGVTVKYDPDNIIHKVLLSTLNQIKKYGVEVEVEVEQETTPVAELITNTCSESNVTVKELKKMTVPALTKIAAKYNIKGRSEMTKKDLIDTLAEMAHL